LTVNTNKILIFGYGNPGRQDDGLGIFFVEELEKWAKLNNLTNITFDSDYQINAETAYDMSLHDRVVFVDASKHGKEPFEISDIGAADTISFSTHAMSPGSVVSLCAELYNKNPAAQLLAIRGYEWEVNENMTGQAGKNLMEALSFFQKDLSGG